MTTHTRAEMLAPSGTSHLVVERPRHVQALQPGHGDLNVSRPHVVAELRELVRVVARELGRRGRGGDVGAFRVAWSRLDDITTH